MTTVQPTAAREALRDLLDERLDDAARGWLAGACRELAGGVRGARFGALLSMASRFVKSTPLAPTGAELERAEELLPGWSPERWTLLETARVALVLAREDLETEAFVRDLEDAFQYADVGELCALYRSLAHLPAAERFVWRAGEGCRTNMTAVFEAVACDTPFPATHFDEVAWKQLVVKCIFIGAPLWRVHGLDVRRSADLSRMALDLVEERRSAGRAIQPELWLCLGPGEASGGDRGREALLEELERGDAAGRRAALFGLCRTGAVSLAREALESGRHDEHLDTPARRALDAALEGDHPQSAWRELQANP